MARIVVKYEDATVYKPSDYDTLEGIVAQECPDFTWEQFALFNWGTKLHPEVNRALIELYGCIEVDTADCTKSKIHAKYAATGATREMRIPKLWKKEGLAVNQTHTAKLKHRKPFPAIRIDALDKWFIPETETCEFNYALEGVKERADKVDFDVYCSKYCKANNAADGKFLKYTFTALDIPLLERKEKLKTDERCSERFDEWKGESEAADGILKPRGKGKRYISVANSPYTVHLRYYKQAADAKARIDVKPFWVQWKYPEPKAIPAPQSLAEKFPLPGAPPVVVPPVAAASTAPPVPTTVIKDSLKIKWEVKDTTRLSHGQILICDKDFNIVFRHALGTADLSQGEHEWTWDDARVKPLLAKMPYRIQIQAHTKIDEDDGLAVAAMHTEVRLYVHKEIGKELFDPLKDNPKDEQCFKLSVAPFWHKPQPPDQGGDEWYRLRLAECGFHPGPVDTEARDEVNNAIKDFQRSIPKRTSPAEAAEEGTARTARQTKTRADKEKAEAELKKKKADEKLAAQEKEVEKLKKEKKEAEDAKQKADTDLSKDSANVDLQNAQQTAVTKLSEATTELSEAEQKLETAKTEFEAAEQEVTDKTNTANTAASELSNAESSAGNAVGGMAGKKWERLTANGSKGADTQDLLDALKVDYHPLMGQPDRSDITGTTAVGDRLKDKNAKAILWVNDRQVNTECDVAPPDAKMKMEGYRGGMQIGDGRVDRDKESVLRPWIPVQAEFPLLSKSDGLDATALPEVTDAMRRAIGPIRVDWTFTELGEDIDVLDVSGTSPNRIRTKAYVAHHIEALKDSRENIYFYNCPEASGGIRTAAASYYKDPFGLDKDSLQPCKAAADDTTKSVYVLCHDDLSQDVEQLYDKFIGKACIYLHPSNIGGDSYRFRGQVCFEKFSGAWVFPNHEFLKERYQRLPQAQTCGLRIWRKTSLRAYSLWAPAGTGNLGTSDAGSRRHYRNAFVHFCDEQGNVEQPTMNTLITNADLDTFKDIITDNSTNDRTQDDFEDDSKVTLDALYVWPWLGEPHWNILASDSAVSMGDYEKVFLNKIWSSTWRKFREPLLHLLLQRLEANTGKLRGHYVAEFQSSGQFWKQRYKCDSCNKKMVMLEISAAGGAGGDCGEGCGGTLEELWVHNYVCDTCNYTFFATETHDSSSHDFDNDPCHETDPNTAAPCTGHYHHDGSSVDKQLEQSGYSNLPVPAVGVGLGATWIFNDGGDAATWAHEIAHHRHFSHAADVDEADTKASEHDRAVNTVDASLAGKGNDGLWDHDCVMSYSSGPQYFCGKCILKNRGWKVNPLVDP